MHICLPQVCVCVCNTPDTVTHTSSRAQKFDGKKTLIHLTNGQ